MIIAISAVFLRRHMRMPWGMNPSVWFVITQLFMILGSIPLLDPARSEADVVHICAMLSVIVLFIAGVEAFDLLTPRVTKDAVVRWRTAPLIVEDSPALALLIGAIIVVSLGVGGIYYYAIGYNVFLDGVRDLFGEVHSGQSWDTMRLQMYAGDEYFAPGYVNQFKNILLPSLTAYLIVKGRLLRRKLGVIVGVSLIPVAFIFIVGTGQRGPLVMSMICTTIFIRMTLPGLRNRQYAILVIGALMAFMLLTLLLRRGVTEVKGIEDVGGLLWALPKRIALDNQYCASVGFRYIYDLPTSWGRDWADGLLSLLPGITQRDTVSSAIHQILFDSPLGTAPLSLIGGLWYNFHFVGVTLVPFLLGYLFQFLHWRMVRSPRTLLGMLTYSAMTFIIASSITGEIRAVFDNGLATMIILRGLGAMAQGVSAVSNRCYAFGNARAPHHAMSHDARMRGDALADSIVTP